MMRSDEMNDEMIDWISADHFDSAGGRALALAGGRSTAGRRWTMGRAGMGRTPTSRRLAGFALIAAALLCATPQASRAQARATAGPVIAPYGAIFDVPFIEIPTNTTMDYRIVFDVAETSENPGEVNRYINSVARFLNMQVRAGVPRENLHLAIVIHGGAVRDGMKPEAFRAEYGVENQNADLLRLLGEAGVQVYMCGQSAMSRGLHNDILVDEVQVGLSAMTVMAMLKEDGYREIN